MVHLKYSMDGKVYGCRQHDSADYVYDRIYVRDSKCKQIQPALLSGIARLRCTVSSAHDANMVGLRRFTCDIIRYVPCKSLKELLKAEEVAIRHFRPTV